MKSREKVREEEPVKGQSNTPGSQSKATGEENHSGYSLVFWLPLKLLHEGDSVLDERALRQYNPTGEAGRDDWLRLASFISRACGRFASGEWHEEDAKHPPDIPTLATLLKTHQKNTLLLVDSFDEASHWVNSPKTPQGQVLRILLGDNSQATPTWQGPNRAASAVAHN